MPGRHLCKDDKLARTHTRGARRVLETQARHPRRLTAGIAGAAALARTDVGAKLQVTVTASNAGGSTPASSAQTATVQAAAGGGGGGGGSSGTFGTTSIGANSDPLTMDRKRVNRYQLPVAANVSKLTVYLQPTGTSGSQMFTGLIYADSGGSPGALLGTDTPAAVPASPTATRRTCAPPSRVR